MFKDTEERTWGYRIWFWFYKNNQIVRHTIGLHQKPRTDSIAPRCDWCGYRSKKQKKIAKMNWEAELERAVRGEEGRQQAYQELR